MKASCKKKYFVTFKRKCLKTCKKINHAAPKMGKSMKKQTMKIYQTRYVTQVTIIHLFLCWISFVSGKTRTSKSNLNNTHYILLSGNPQDDYVYEEPNYDDEEVVYINPEPNVNLSHYNPEIKTRSQTIEVDAGTTIRLPCEIANLPGRLRRISTLAAILTVLFSASAGLYQFVLWARLDTRNTLIATGDRILTQEYQKRGKVTVDHSGSTLIIAVAQDHDAGRYKCSLTLGDVVQEVEHTVMVRGENSP